MLTHMIGLKNICKWQKCPSTVNCRIFYEPTTVNCRWKPRQL